ncbi:MAG: hypothetical protein HRU12_22080, partial [Phaeodactylibacter sp.]|nr:hypothetical protein [Phaeodactylibacter sp.]
AISEFTKIHRQLPAQGAIDWLLAFVTLQQEVETLSKAISEQISGDLLLWLAYPKKSSKRFQSDINRDYGWAPVGALEMEPVRQVAIDEDWSALRFRRVAFIKSMKRRQSMRISKKGRSKDE